MGGVSLVKKDFKQWDISSLSLYPLFLLILDLLKLLSYMLENCSNICKTIPMGQSKITQQNKIQPLI